MCESLIVIILFYRNRNIELHEVSFKGFFLLLFVEPHGMLLFFEMCVLCVLSWH